MEFLRFGSSIPGAYWGCCACDIIQDMKQDPDQKYSISVVNGDGGTPMTNASGIIFLGKTYHEVFKSRLRIDTFSTEDMPNHAFFCIMTAQQIVNDPGKKWLKILKEEGFEFIRTVDNSVYTGTTLAKSLGSGNSHENHIFGLFRNIGHGSVADPYKAPEAWEKLPDPYGGDTSLENQFKVQKELWNKLGPAQFYSDAELTAANIPIHLAGMRSTNPQEPKTVRDARERQNTKAKVANPFGKAA